MNDFVEKQWPIILVVALVIVSIAMSDKIMSTNLPGKGLQFKMVEVFPIAPMADLPQPDIGLTIDGKPVDKAFLASLVLRNTGNIPIAKADFDTPILIQVKNDAEIIQLRYGLYPAEINTDVTFSRKKVTLAPSLINPGDMIFIHVFTRGGKPEFDVGARIQGVNKIYVEEGDVESRMGELTGLNYIVFIISMSAIMVMAMVLKAGHKSNYMFLRYKTAVILFLILGLITLYTYFDLLLDNTIPFYTSPMLLIGSALVAYLIAWWIVRHSERPHQPGSGSGIPL